MTIKAQIGFMTCWVPMCLTTSMTCKSESSFVQSWHADADMVIEVTDSEGEENKQGTQGQASNSWPFPAPGESLRDTLESIDMGALITFEKGAPRPRPLHPESLGVDHSKAATAESSVSQKFAEVVKEITDSCDMDAQIFARHSWMPLEKEPTSQPTLSTPPGSPSGSADSQVTGTAPEISSPEISSPEKESQTHSLLSLMTSCPYCEFSGRSQHWRGHIDTADKKCCERNRSRSPIRDKTASQNPDISGMAQPVEPLEPGEFHIMGTRLPKEIPQSTPKPAENRELTEEELEAMIDTHDDGPPDYYSKFTHQEPSWDDDIWAHKIYAYFNRGDPMC